MLKYIISLCVLYHITPNIYLSLCHNSPKYCLNSCKKTQTNNDHTGSGWIWQNFSPCGRIFLMTWPNYLSRSWQHCAGGMLTLWRRIVQYGTKGSHIWKVNSGILYMPCTSMDKYGKKPGRILRLYIFITEIVFFYLVKENLFQKYIIFRTNKKIY